MLDDESKKDLIESFDDAHLEVEESITALLETNIPAEESNQLNRLFRAIHTIKGNAGMLKLTSIVGFAHAVEEVTSALRNKQFSLTPAIAETLLIAMDRLHDLHQQELFQKHFEHLRIDSLTVLYTSMSLATHDEVDIMAAQTLEFLGAGIANYDTQLFANAEPPNQENIKSLDSCDIDDKVERDLLYFQQTALELDFMEETWGGRSIQLFDWAMKMNAMSGNPIDEKQFAAAIYLHDIGMTFVPNQDWRNKLTLGQDEHHPIARHPDWGYQYLVRIPGWEEAATIIREHHEHVDGTGYPNGLKGEEIHPGAKILSILDTFFFLTNGSVDPSKRKSTVRAVSAINSRIDAVFEGMWVQCFNHMVREELRAGNI